MAVAALEALVREYGQEKVELVSANVARVRVPWSYTPPGGQKVTGEVEVAVPLTLDGILELVTDGTYREEQMLAFVRRGAVLAATQAQRQAAQRGTTARESIQRQLERLAQRAAQLGVNLEELLNGA